MLIECQLSNGGKWWRIESYFFVLSSNRRTCVVPRYLFLKVRPKSAVRHFNRSMQSLFFVIAKNYEPLVRRMCQNEWITEIFIILGFSCTTSPYIVEACARRKVWRTRPKIFSICWCEIFFLLFIVLQCEKSRQFDADSKTRTTFGHCFAIPSYHKFQ